MYIITDNEGVPHPDDTIGGDNMLFHMVSFPKSHFETHPIDLNADIYIQTNTQVTLNNGTVVPAGTRKPLFNVFYWVDFYERLNDYVYCIENDTFELIQKGQTDLVPYMNEFNEVPYNSLPFEYIANNMAILFVGITDKNDPTRVYNVNQNWAELNLTYIANISKPTTYFVCKSATTAEKQAEFTVLHAVRIF